MRKSLLAALLLTLVGCSSTTFVYNRLNLIIPWYVGKYVDLSRDQKKFLDAELQPFLHWHRHEELPAYLKVMDEMEAALDAEVSQAQVADIALGFEEAWLRIESRGLEWMLANVGLIMYVTVLGERGDAWATQRRVGTILFFSFTFLSQLLLLAQLRRLHLERVNVRLLNTMWAVCSALLFLGVLTVVLDAWNEAWYESVEDAFEWVLSLLLQSNFLLGYFVWRQADWHLEVK